MEEEEEKETGLAAKEAVGVAAFLGSRAAELVFS